MKLNKCLKFFLLLCLISFYTANKIKTEESINISEFKMKHKSSHLKTNSKSTTSSFNSNANAHTATNTNTAVSTNHETSSKASDASNTDQSHILYTTWAKFFKYLQITAEQKNPSSFFKNNQFAQQVRLFPNANLKEVSSDGTTELDVYIPDNTSFYIKLFTNTINFISSRQVN